MTRRRNISIAIFVIITILFIIYIIFNSRLLISGPKLIIHTPQDGQRFDEPFTEIKGNVQNSAFISLNDRQILIDEEGDFTEKLLLYPGISIIKLYAQDKFGREIEQTLNLYLEGGEIIDISNIKVDVATSTVSDLDNNGTSTATTTEFINEN